MRRKEKYKVDIHLLENALAIGKQIGHTPVRLFKHPEHININVWAKVEWAQLSGSVKARAAFDIIYDALSEGRLNTEIILLDATSGNTGIAYATICHQLGIRVTLCIPANASIERKIILKRLGVEIIYTSPLEGTDGAQKIALELASQYPGKYFYADQYKNENNWKAHYRTTATEIMKSVPGITHFVAGLGTTGTFIGTGRGLKDSNSSIVLVALQPDSALHGLEGWKHLETVEAPQIYDDQLADAIEEISTEEAYALIRTIYNSEKLLLSPSSAANLAGAFRIAERIKESIVVTILPDNADKYSEVIKKLNL